MTDKAEDICKGDLSLGSGCKRCARCAQQFEARISALQDERDLRTVQRDGANERVQLMLNSKNRWKERAIAAETQLSVLRGDWDQCRQAAQAVVNRWASPLWRQEVGTNSLINDLREAIGTDPASREPLTEIQKQALELYTPPFQFHHGYIFDSAGHMFADEGRPEEAASLIAVRIRGWGRLGKLSNGAEVQDAAGQLVVDALNGFWEQHGVGATDD